MEMSTGTTLLQRLFFYDAQKRRCVSDKKDVALAFKKGVRYGLSLGEINLFGQTSGFDLKGRQN